MVNGKKRMISEQSSVFILILLVELFRLEEKALYRTVNKKKRANDLMQQSRLPFSSQKSKRSHRSMSASDLTRLKYEEFSFRPKTNGYYVPNFNKLHSKLSRDMEESKRTRSPTRCKPFLLYTNLIPSKKDKILTDIQNDAQHKHRQTFQIKGKQMPPKSTSIVNLSASLDKSESIPTKMTEAQRLREAVGRKKRQEEEERIRSAENLHRSKSAKDRRIRENIRERAKLPEQTVLSRAKKDDNVSSSLFIPWRISLTLLRILLRLDTSNATIDTSK